MGPATIVSTHGGRGGYDRRLGQHNLGAGQRSGRQDGVTGGRSSIIGGRGGAVGGPHDQ